MAEQVKKRGGILTPVIVILAMALVLFVMPFGVGVRLFRAPSGSMQPTIMRGDYFVAAKWAYGYSRYSSAPLSLGFPPGRIFSHAPERGDVVVFRPPPEPDRDFVKRVVGLPGDRIQMIDGVLHINGQAVGMEALGPATFTDDGETVNVQAFRETLPGGVSYTIYDRMPDWELDNTREFVVPEGHYFLMGDDRDNSADSRTSTVGNVPLDNFVGRVVQVIHARRQGAQR